MLSLHYLRPQLLILCIQCSCHLLNPRQLALSFHYHGFQFQDPIPRVFHPPVHLMQLFNLLLFGLQTFQTGLHILSQLGSSLALFLILPLQCNVTFLQIPHSFLILPIDLLLCGDVVLLLLDLGVKGVDELIEFDDELAVLVEPIASPCGVAEGVWEVLDFFEFKFIGMAHELYWKKEGLEDGVGSVNYIIVELKDEGLCDGLLGFGGLLDGGQHDPALLPGLDEAVEGVVVQGVELHFLPDLRNVDLEGRVRNEAEQPEFGHSHEELPELLVDFFGALPDPHFLLDLVEDLPDAIRVLDFCEDLLVGGLEGLSQHVHDGPIQRVEGARHADCVHAGGEVAPDEEVHLLEGFEVEKDDALHGHFGAEDVEEHVQALVLVELRELVADLVVHWEAGRGVRETGYHLPQVPLQGHHLLLQLLLLPHRLLLVLLGRRQLPHHRLELGLEVVHLCGVRAPGEQARLFVFVVLKVAGFALVGPGLGFVGPGLVEEVALESQFFLSGEVLHKRILTTKTVII